MEVRPIDAIELQKRMCTLCNQDYSDEPCDPSDCVFVRAINEAPTLTPQWISVKERLPEAEQEVCVACKTRTFGYRYQCQGFYVPRGVYREDSEFAWDYEACDEYDEERDDYLVNEGWYERIHNWDEYGAVSISDIVTHWMPLPDPPNGKEAPHE